jgi:hypothetical protein
LLLGLNLAVLLAGWGGTAWQGQGAPLVTFNAHKLQLLEDVLPEGVRAPDEAPAPEGGVEAKALANCPSWPGLDAEGVAQVQAHLRKAGVADAHYDLLVEMRMGWWVYIPPLENAAALQRVMEDARAKGIKDMTPVRSGSLLNALALGTFATLEGASKHAEDMTKKGLREVRFAPRPGAGAVRLAVVRDSTELQRALAGPWPPGLEPGNCKQE